MVISTKTLRRVAMSFTAPLLVAIIVFWFATLLPTAALGGGQFGGEKKQKGPETRDLKGQVFDAGDMPVEGAVVFLKNRNKQTEKSVITGKDGAFHFGSLSPDEDYELHAEHQGKKSEIKTLSELDAREKVNMNLTIR